MSNKMKKVVGFLISTVMIFSLCIGVSQNTQAEENMDPVEFIGATEIGNTKWTDPGIHREYNVYLNDTGKFVNENSKVPARGPVHIELNKAYKTRMDNTLGSEGSVYDPGTGAYYYFTLENPTKVSIYGQCSTASNSMLSIEKIDDMETFDPSTTPFGAVMSDEKVKSISTCLSAGNYLIALNWGQGRPDKAGEQYSYVKVNVDNSINQETDDEWYETFPNEGINEGTSTRPSYKYVCTPYKIGKKMNGVTGVGSLVRTNEYLTGFYSFTITEKTQLNFVGLTNINYAYVFPQNGGCELPANRITDTMVLEPDDYVLKVYAQSRAPYSFTTSTSPVSAIAGVDTMATSGWSVSGETVTINNLNVNAEDYEEFCIYSGDKDNAGYGKGLAKLVVKGNCYVKTLVIDCPVEVTCEAGAKLVVGKLVVNTADEANGKLTYTSGTTYDAATKTFEVSRTHTTHTWDAGTVTTVATCKTKGVKTFKCTVEGCTGTKTEEIAIDANNHVNTEVLNAKDATCTEKGYTGDTHCKDCDTTVTGTDIAATGHKWDSGKVTKEPTVSAEGVETFTCVNSGCNETKTEAIAKLPEPKKNEVIEDKTGNDYKVTDPEKKEVSYKAPASKKAKTVTISASVTIDGVTYKVTKIDDNAFKGNTTVTKITIPSTVTTIGKDAFNGCKKLKTVSVPKNVTEIGKNAFKGCAALTKVTLPSKCTKIGANAFDGCKKMKTITIKSTKLTSKSIASGAFKGLSKNVTIKVPKKQLKAYKKLLKKKGFKGKVKA